MLISKYIWSLLTNNGMYSSQETIVIIVLSAIIGFSAMSLITYKVNADVNETMINDLDGNK